MEGGGNELINVLKLVFGHQDTMALKCAVELRIADIIHSNGSPMSVSEIASHFGSPTPNLRCLESLMRFLVRKNIFTATPLYDNQSDESLYGLTPSSRLILHGPENTTTSGLLLLGSPWYTEPWQKLSETIKQGGTAFNKAHGCSFWELTSRNQEFNNLFNAAMVGQTKVDVEGNLTVLKDRFQGVKTLVDIGGGTGYFVSEIVKANSLRIKGINFDLPHVIENAPVYPGVTHVAGDMFNSVIPSGDVIVLKAVLHDWDDEDCRKILRNCKSAISETKGKLMLLEMVVQPQEEGWMPELGSTVDLLMNVLVPGGRERTRLEWTNLLKEVGFTRINFINTHIKTSVIEAYP